MAEYQAGRTTDVDHRPVRGWTDIRPVDQNLPAGWVAWVVGKITATGDEYRYPVLLESELRGRAVRASDAPRVFTYLRDCEAAAEHALDELIAALLKEVGK